MSMAGLNLKIVSIGFVQTLKVLNELKEKLKEQFIIQLKRRERV